MDTAKPRLPIVAVPLVLASAGWANVTTYQGYTTTTEGGAVSVEVGTKLTVLGIGSTGNDGVSIDLTTHNGSANTAGCWSIGLDTLTLPPGAWIEIRTRGTIGAADALVTSERFTGVAGGIGISLDETPLAPSGTTTISTRGCVRVSTTSAVGATLGSGAVIVPSTPRVITFAASSASTLVAGIQFANSWSGGVPNWLDSTKPDLDRAQVSSTTSVVPTAHTRIQIRASGISQFTLTSLATDTFGAACEPRLIITKLIDGPLSTGRPNWVELTNVSNLGIQMSQFSLGHFPTGSTTMSGGAPVPLGPYLLPAGKSYVVAYEPTGCSGLGCFQSAYGIAPNQQVNDPTFDGTSTFVLFRGVPTGANGSGGELVDTYGTIGGLGTTNPPDFRRGYSGRTTSHPSTDFLESQWQFAGPDYFWQAGQSDQVLLSLLVLLVLPGDYQGCGSGTPGVFCDGQAGSGCPCGNISGPGGGCLNSFGTSGALSASTYLASVAEDSSGMTPLVLQAQGLPMSSGLFFQGTSRLGGGLGVPFGDGLRCVGGAVLRLGTRFATGLPGNAVTMYGGGGDIPISIQGIVPAAGATRHYQYWYRNAAVYCVAAATFNLTNALTVQWGP